MASEKNVATIPTHPIKYTDSEWFWENLTQNLVSPHESGVQHYTRL
jgi:hypothetical protein